MFSLPQISFAGTRGKEDVWGKFPLPPPLGNATGDRRFDCRVIEMTASYIARKLHKEAHKVQYHILWGKWAMPNSLNPEALHEGTPDGGYDQFALRSVGIHSIFIPRPTQRDRCTCLSIMKSRLNVRGPHIGSFPRPKHLKIRLWVGPYAMFFLLSASMTLYVQKELQYMSRYV